jgi:Protein of unknown function (DUF4038)/Domain of unknown function (DUF5060)
MRTHQLAGVCLILLLTACVPSAAQTEVKPWEVVEVTLECQKSLESPYVESLPDHGQALARVVFEGTTGEALGHSYSLDAFWDGGVTFKARFAPPFAGQWAYRTKSADPSMATAKGTFTCIVWTDAEKAENATRRGFVRVCRSGSRPGRYFEYADGTPFLWMGDTWWNWTKRGIHLSSFEKLADDRVQKGFTIGQLFFAGRGWGSQSSLLDLYYKTPDLEQVRHVEAMIRYANSKGITVWIHPWWGGRDLDRQIGAENIRRWWRYVIARLSAYNVVWTLAGE